MLEMIMLCAPNVAPQTIQAIIKVESSGNPLAVNVNKKQGVAYPLPTKFKSTEEAVRASYSAISKGHSVDLGYMQVNSANLKKLGYTVEDMFDPCKNITAGAHILTLAYKDALPRHKSEQAALRVALSRYNTGSATRGFENGYVAKYVGGTRSTTVKLNPYTSSALVWSNIP